MASFVIGAVEMINRLMENAEAVLAPANLKNVVLGDAPERGVERIRGVLEEVDDVREMVVMAIQKVKNLGSGTKETQERHAKELAESLNELKKEKQRFEKMRRDLYTRKDSSVMNQSAINPQTGRFLPMSAKVLEELEESIEDLSKVLDDLEKQIRATEAKQQESGATTTPGGVLRTIRKPNRNPKRSRTSHMGMMFSRKKKRSKKKRKSRRKRS